MMIYLHSYCLIEYPYRLECDLYFDGANVFRICHQLREYRILNDYNSVRNRWGCHVKPFYVPQIPLCDYKIINEGYLKEEIQKSINHIHKTLLIEL